MNRWRRKQDLRSRLQRAFNLILLGVALIGVLGVGSRVVGLQAVNELIYETQPLLESNAEFLQVLTDAQSAQRGYRLTHDGIYLERYNRAIRSVPELASGLRARSAELPEIRALLSEEVKRATKWMEEFSLPTMERVRADVTFQPDRAASAHGNDLFDAVRDANQKAETAMEVRADRVEAEVRRTTINAGLGSVVFLSLGILAAAVMSRRTTAFVANPLEDLRHTIARLAEGDFAARATVEGPTEIQSVAEAINEMAESRERFHELQQETMRQLESLDQARADFISSVSHELRTPLTSVTGYAEMLLDGDAGPLGSEQEKMIRTIDRNARRLLDLVEDILTVARMDVGVQRLSPEPVNVADLIESAVDAVRPSLVARALSLRVDVPPVVGAIRADRGQLERVLLNLLSNAVKFTPRGGRITVAAEKRAGTLSLSVSDTGMGIPIAEQPRMFQRFFRSSTSRDEVIPGTGLGLSIVKSIVEGHGGSIEFDSTPGRGTTFRVELPADGPPSPAGQTGPA
ncbi:MAG TPA: ATP-binding protein [Acidimicrobiales bacterium]|nr:ATP-binding protein [Acidimicrobiales bacterium]